MALRKLRIEGDPILRKVSRPVKEINERYSALFDDMVETMETEYGVGLAAPQVGILRRMIVINVGDGVYKMANPEILEQEGKCVDVEGCLSVPNFRGTVERPKKIKVRYMDENNEWHEMEAEDLKARCICHEIDHLNGVLFIDKYIDEVKDLPESATSEE